MSKPTYRSVLITVLGGKCSCTRSDCWHDSHCGVSDLRCLHIDHINGDGVVDRKRFGSDEAMCKYYLDYPNEARTRVQLLCANCNTVKMSWNDERRQAKPYGDIRERIEELPSYGTLLLSFRDIVSAIAASGETSLLDEMRRYGLADSTKHPLSYCLSRNWSQQVFYGSDATGLSAFLVEKELLLSSMGKRLAIRKGAGRSPITR